MTQITSLDAATSGTGLTLPCHDSKQLRFYVRFSAGVSAGAVAIETSSSTTFAGTPAAIASYTGADDTEYSDVEPGPLFFVRARITTPIVGGTVTVYLAKMEDRSFSN